MKPVGRCPAFPLKFQMRIDRRSICLVDLCIFWGGRWINDSDNSIKMGGLLSLRLVLDFRIFRLLDSCTVLAKSLPKFFLLVDLCFTFSMEFRQLENIIWERLKLYINVVRVTVIMEQFFLPLKNGSRDESTSSEKSWLFVLSWILTNSSILSF